MTRKLPTTLLFATAFIATPAFARDEGGEEFFSFEPAVAIQYDLGRIDVPDVLTSVDQDTLDEFRRVRFGGEGDIGGLSYEIEFNYTDDDLSLLDLNVSRDFGAVELTVGNMKPNLSLDEQTSSKSGNFLERASFTDAFAFDRRAGVQARWDAGEIDVRGGVFVDNLDVILTDRSNLWSANARVVWAPKVGETQLHFGASTQHTEYDDAPTAIRYRQRPLFHATDTRFVDTGNLAASSEDFYGIEAAAVMGAFYAAAEHGWLDVSRGGGDVMLGGGYVEAGWSITGEPRDYGGGRFDRPEIARPITEGGPGNVTVAARYDWLDLDDGAVAGGTQKALGASLIWAPVDLLRLSVNYTRVGVDGGPFAAAFADRDFSADVIGTRIQLAF